MPERCAEELFKGIWLFDSRWVPPVGGAPSRHTGTGGAAAGVHAQCLRDSGAGDTSLVVPRAAARRSLVVPRAAARRSLVVPQSKQLGSQARRRRAEASSWADSQMRRCRAHEEMRGPTSGRAQEGRRSPERGQRNSGSRNCVLRVFFWDALLLRRRSRIALHKS
jgi:hypothetical protein